jgi:hypothetical protein
LQPNIEEVKHSLLEFESELNLLWEPIFFFLWVRKALSFTKVMIWMDIELSVYKLFNVIDWNTFECFFILVRDAILSDGHRDRLHQCLLHFSLSHCNLMGLCQFESVTFRSEEV